MLKTNRWKWKKLNVLERMGKDEVMNGLDEEKVSGCGSGTRYYSEERGVL